MRARGQPFRFLALVGAGWVGVRIALLWPAGSLPEAIRSFKPPAPAATQPPSHLAVITIPAIREIRRAPLPRRAFQATDRAPPAYGTMLRAAHSMEEMTPEPPPPFSSNRPERKPPERYEAPPVPPSEPVWLAPMPDRWSVGGWIVVRAGSGTGAAPGGGQLGGAQAGVRAAFRIDPSARVAAFARLTTPLAGKGREAAIGVEWQPGRIPVRIVVEQRFGLDGTAGGTGLGVVAGLDASVRSVRIETYGQAGVIARSRTEPYADGAIRITSPVRNGSAPVALGAGAWGGAQRGAQRLDIGPSMTVAHQSVRISLDWRQRIAGRARPGSGLALTIGGDF